MAATRLIVLNDAGVVARDNFYIIKPRERTFLLLYH
jgi:hypothetical protein